MDPTTLGIICGGIAIVVVGVLAWYFMKKRKSGFRAYSYEEGFAPARRLEIASRYAAAQNKLMPVKKQVSNAKPLMLPISNAHRGNIPMNYLLPSNGVKKPVGRRGRANVKQTPPVIGGTETKKAVPAKATGVALNVSTEEKIKAGANSIGTTDFKDKSVPDTSALPAVVQSGVIDEPKKEGFAGGNTRISPPFLSNGTFFTEHKLQRGGISTSSDGQRPSKHAGA